MISCPDYETGENLDANVLLIITASNNGKINIHVPYTNTAINQNLSTGSNFFNISGKTLADNRAVRTKGIYIQTTVLVSVHVIRVLPYLSVFSFMALPVPSLSEKYIATCYTNHNSYNEGFTYVTVTAMADANVNLTLPFEQNSSTLIGFERNLATGDLVTVKLGVFEVINFGLQHDLTGTLIESDSPVFVTSGACSPVVPYRGRQDNFNAQDVVATLLPVNLWQKEFITTPFMNNDGYVARIVAATENTTVHIVTKMKPINVMLSKPGSFYDHVLNTSVPLYIYSDKPVSVVQFSNTAVNNTAKEGNSVMFEVQPLNYYSSYYTFTVPNNVWMPQPDKAVYHYIVITIVTEFESCLKYDKASLPSPIDRQFLLVGNTEYVVITLSVHAGHHTLTCSDINIGFGLISYGFTRGSGYGYPVRFKY